MSRVSVPIPGPLVAARFESRPQQFVVVADLAARGRVEAHLPDPGRLAELLVPGRRIWLRPASGRRRRTSWTAVLVEGPGGPVCLDTLLPNRLVRLALERRALPELADYDLVRTELSVGRSRFDLLLAARSGRRQLLVEVKSVTLGAGRSGLFPDAPTGRGARHLAELAGLVEKRTYEAVVLFVVQRRGATRVEPHAELDPRFAAALVRARDAGVRLLARRCRVDLEQATLDEPLPVVADSSDSR